MTTKVGEGMKRLLCRWFGHDWLYLNEDVACDCNPYCRGTYRQYMGTLCRRCDEREEAPQLLVWA